MDRQGLSVSSLARKRKRYDPSAARNKKYYATSKRMKDYSRMVRKETKGQTKNNSFMNRTFSDIPDDPQAILNPHQTHKKKPKYEEKSKSKSKQSKQNEEKNESENEDSSEAEEQQVKQTQHHDEKELTKPKTNHKTNKKERVIRKSRAELQEEWKKEEEARRTRLNIDKNRRAHKRRLANEKTRKGQPVMKNQMSKLLAQLQRATRD